MQVDVVEACVDGLLNDSKQGGLNVKENASLHSHSFRLCAWP